MSRIYKTGFDSLRFDKETILRLLDYVKVKNKPVLVENIVEIYEYRIETLVLINPDISGNDKQKFLEFIKDGGTALLMLSGEIPSFNGSHDILHTLGVSVDLSRELSKIKIEYTENYPVEWKRNTKDYFLQQNKKKFVQLHYESGDRYEITTLIKKRSILSSDNLSISIKLGNGEIIVMDSASLPEDRADLLTYLLKRSKIQHSEDSMKLELKQDIKQVLKIAMSNYEKMPIAILRKKINVDMGKLDDVELMLVVEEVISENDLPYKIDIDTIILK